MKLILLKPGEMFPYAIRQYDYFCFICQMWKPMTNQDRSLCPVFFCMLDDKDTVLLDNKTDVFVMYRSNGTFAAFKKPN